MIVQNLDTGGVEWVPDGAVPRNPALRPPLPAQPAPAALSEPLPDCIALPWPVNPPRVFPPITGPLYTVQPRVSVQSYALALFIIFAGLIAFLFLIAWLAS